ncbi:MAG: 30S ribosomal protein S1 [Candidatus Coatesbacteria bacterium]|nr:MAG: 30S ribosomal protein S1 [Candidatus Coatesbacteria bacterium]
MNEEQKVTKANDEPEVMPEEEGIDVATSGESEDTPAPTEPDPDAEDAATSAETPAADESAEKESEVADKQAPTVWPESRKRKPDDRGKKTATKSPMTPVATEDDVDEKAFAEMAELYEESFKELEEDSIVKGTIVAVTKEDVLVDIGYKSEGSIPVSEFKNAVELKVGDELEVYLEKKEDQDGLIVLSKEKADFFRAWDKVREVYEANGEIEGVISDKVRGGFIVDIGVRAFLPSSQLDIRPVSDFDAFLGKTFSFKVIKVNRRRRNIVLSRKALLDEARAEMKAELLSTLRKGLVLEGEVKNLTDFGAFIDLGGLDGLLHITDITWGRVRHPSDMLSIGDKLEVMVLDFDTERERVSLGMKQLKAHPWENIKTRYEEGTKIIGTVVSIVDYGAFVELEEGIEGLIHISEMSWTHRVKHPSKILSVGDEVETVILSVDEENQRISLGLRQTMENPWEDIAKRFAPGTVFEGVVRNITDFGAFVELEEGIDGLVRISDMSWTKRIRHPSDVLTKGETVRVVVLNVDAVNQRISLGLKQLDPNPWDAIEQSYPVGTYVDGEIVRVTNYGAIVRFEDELEGLLHISEIAGERVTKVSEFLGVGDRVRVKVINVSAKDRRINLSLWQYQQETGEEGLLEKAEPGAAEKLEEALEEGEEITTEEMAAETETEERPEPETEKPAGEETEEPAAEEKTEEPETAEEEPGEEPAPELPVEEEPAETVDDEPEPEEEKTEKEPEPEKPEDETAETAADEPEPEEKETEGEPGQEKPEDEPAETAADEPEPEEEKTEKEPKPEKPEDETADEEPADDGKEES